MSKVKSYYGGSTSHYYTYNGSTLVQEKIVTSGSQTTEYLTFLYNSEGPTGFVYNNTLYTYRKNIFGDIIAVYNGTSKVAEYAYDAYGNCTIVFATGNAGILNPFRYRGYYFDEDMKLYYLQSRYYDPETGRFINADDVSYLDPETIHGLNLYAYCLNNPVMYVDPSGHSLLGIFVASVIIGGLIGSITSTISGIADGKSGGKLALHILGGALLGAVLGAATTFGGVLGTGALAATAGNVIGGLAFSGIASFAAGVFKYAAQEVWTKENASWDWSTALANGGIAAVQGLVSFGIGAVMGGAGMWESLKTGNTFKDVVNPFMSTNRNIIAKSFGFVKGTFAFLKTNLGSIISRSLYKSIFTLPWIIFDMIV